MLNIEEVITQMQNKIEEVKKAAAAKRPLISEEDRAKLDAMVEKTISVVKSAGEKVAETIGSLGEEVNADQFLSRVQNKCNEACDYTISKITEMKENEEIRKKLDDVTKEIGDSFDELMANEDVKRVVEGIKNATNSIRDSVTEFISKKETQENISKAKKAILHVADKAFSGLHSLLDETEEKVEEVTEVETHEENSNEIHE